MCKTHKALKSTILLFLVVFPIHRKAVRTDKAMEGDIVRACFDGSERRLLLASSLGEILVYRFLQVLSGLEVV